MWTFSTSNSSCLPLLDQQQQLQLQLLSANSAPTPVHPPLLAPPPQVPVDGATAPPPPPPAEQLCYVHCNLCDTVLAVSVPCTSLFRMVTVRCGHCTNLLPVNMRALLLPSAIDQHQLNFARNLFLTTPAPPHNHHHLLQDEIPNFGTRNFPVNPMAAAAANCFAGGVIPDDNPIMNNPFPTRPPEKRQRVPSAYNRFIKDEIQRIKAGNPDISHREAFSAAAKNWAHFPHIHFGLMPDQTLKKTTAIRLQGEDHDVLMKDGYSFFAASANVGISSSPY